MKKLRELMYFFLILGETKIDKKNIDYFKKSLSEICMKKQKLVENLFSKLITENILIQLWNFLKKSDFGK
jgi:hypothetical protein